MSDSKNKKNALVVEGGAMRGIFSAGVLDAFIKEKFNPFDLCIGVSAGSINMAGFLAGMYLRSYKAYTVYSTRPEFISWKNFFLGKHLVDIDWLCDITYKEIRLDLDRIINSSSEFLVGLTEVTTGKAVYLKPDGKNLEEILKASSAIPVLYRKFVKINGINYTDGGISDPIPVMEAYKRGARNITVIRSRPFSKILEAGRLNLIVKLFLKKYPALIKTVLERQDVYNESINFLRKKHDDMNINEINPPENFRTKRLTTDIEILNNDYDKGLLTGMDFIKKWKNNTLL